VQVLPRQLCPVFPKGCLVEQDIRTAGQLNCFRARARIAAVDQDWLVTPQQDVFQAHTFPCGLLHPPLLLELPYQRARSNPESTQALHVDGGFPPRRQTEAETGDRMLQRSALQTPPLFRGELAFEPRLQLADNQLKGQLDINPAER